jgi:hypothetical protein
VALDPECGDVVRGTGHISNMSTTPAPPAPAQRAGGQAPKPGLTSCPGKYEGRWEHVSGVGGMKVVFRSGKATITEGLGGEMPFDCFTGDGKVVFYKAGHPSISIVALSKERPRICHLLRTNWMRI